MTGSATGSIAVGGMVRDTHVMPVAAARNVAYAAGTASPASQVCASAAKAGPAAMPSTNAAERGGVATTASHRACG